MESLNQNMWNNDITFIFYSHSDYSDLWEIVSDALIHIPTTYKRCIAINSNSLIKPSGFDDILTYNDTLNYSDKILSLLNQLNTKYVAFIHDNDLVMSFSESIFIDLIGVIKLYNIDRCIFGVLGRSNPSIRHEHFDLVDSKIINTPHFRIPYDVGPSIWRVEAFKNALSHVPNTSYRDIEDSAIQSYCRNHLNVYGFCSNEIQRPYYVIGRPFPEKFQFLHLLVRGKLFPAEAYMDQVDNLNKLMNKYPRLLNRERFDRLYSVNPQFRTV